MDCYKKLTLSLYLQDQLNHQENILMIEIEYWFLLKNNFGQYWVMNMEWWHIWWLNLMKYLMELMEPLINI